MIGRLNRFAALTCYGCEAVLGWTSPGEARRMHTRARAYCITCRDKKALALTKREQDLIEAAERLSEAGVDVTFAELAREIGVSRSWVQQLVKSIKGRGRGELLDLISFSEPVVEEEEVPPPVVVEPVVVPLPPLEPGEVIVVETVNPPEPQPIVGPPMTLGELADSGAATPRQGDPASYMPTDQFVV